MKKTFKMTYANNGDDAWVYSGPEYVANGDQIEITAFHELATTGTKYFFVSNATSSATFSKTKGTATDANGESTVTVTVSNITADGTIRILATNA